MNNGDQSAYPLSMDVVANSGPNTNATGLTKREMIAAMALQGLVSSSELIGSLAELAAKGKRGEFLASLSIELADELLKKLETK